MKMQYMHKIYMIIFISQSQSFKSIQDISIGATQKMNALLLMTICATEMCESCDYRLPEKQSFQTMIYLFCINHLLHQSCRR